MDKREEMSRMTGGPGPSRSRLLGMLFAALLVALAAVLPYVSTLDSYFLGDDFGIVQLYGNKPALHFLSLFTRSWHEDIGDTLPMSCGRSRPSSTSSTLSPAPAPPPPIA